MFAERFDAEEENDPQSLWAQPLTDKLTSQVLVLLSVRKEERADWLTGSQ